MSQFQHSILNMIFILHKPLNLDIKIMYGLCQFSYAVVIFELLKPALRNVDYVASISSFQNGCLNNKEVWLRSRRGEIL
jgi:hypothetical protein